MRGLRGIGISGLTSPVLSSSCIGGWNGVPLNNYAGALGDSLTSACSTRYYRTYYASTDVSPYEWFLWTLPKTGDAVSTGLVLPGNTSATSGASLDTIGSTLLTAYAALAIKDGVCLVLGGTNDLAGFINGAAYTAAVEKLVAIWRTLIGMNILPIALGIPTTNNATNRPRVPIFNAAIEAAATALSTEMGFTIPYLDTYAITDNGVDGWIATYSSDDNVHWGPIGAAVVGQAIRDNIFTPLESGFSTPNLVTAGNDTGGDIIYENGTMVDDANSDGIPDGGQVQGAYWTIVTGGADVTHSLVEEAGVVSGKWWRINKTAHTANYYILGKSAGIAFVPGATYEFGYMCKILTPHADAVISISLYNQADGGSVHYQEFKTLAGEVKPYAIYSRFTAPANANYLRMFVKILDATSDVYIGQLTIRKV